MIDKLRALATEFPDLIRDVRGAGAIFGVELAIAAGPVVEGMLGRHVIANATSENVIRLVPPLIYEREHVEEMIDVLRQCLVEAVVD